MTNIQRLSNAENKNLKLFADTVLTFKNSQGFYSRLYQSVNELNEENYESLITVLNQQNFNDSIDVVLWLEQ